MLDFDGLSDDQLVELFRAICAEANRRNPAVAAAAKAAGLDEAEKSRIAAEAAAREAGAQRARERQRVAEEAVAKVRAEANARQAAAHREGLRQQERWQMDTLARAAELVGRKPADICIVWYDHNVYVNEGNNRYNPEHLFAWSYDGVRIDKSLVANRTALIDLCQSIAGKSDSCLAGDEFDWTHYQPTPSAGASA